MTGNKKVKLGRVFTIAGAVIAFLIGSGFATGQEIMQYFTSYGFGGILVGLTTLIVFVYVCSDFIATGKREKITKGNQIYTYYCGKYIGAFYDYFSIAFLFMSYVVMIGGAGATLNEHYGLPTYVGGIAMAVVAGSVVMLGLGKIVDVIGKIGPIIVLISVGIGLFAVISNPSGIAEGAALIESGEVEVTQVGTSWLTSASSYVGFCMLWLAGFLAAMGGQTNSTKEGRLGTSLGSLGFVLGCLILMFGFLAYLPEVAGADIPSLIIANKITPAFGTIFSIIIMAGIFTTSVPLLWQVSARWTKEKTKPFYITTAILAAAGCFIGLALPFSGLVNIIYGINGYVGIILLVFIIGRNIQRVYLSKKNKVPLNEQILEQTAQDAPTPQGEQTLQSEQAPQSEE